MCGIVGLINKDGSTVDLDLLSRMADKISHRGPDEEGHLIAGSVGLYHKRLSIIDLVSGKQPIISGSATIVFNGAIYNYVELRESLKSKGHSSTLTLIRSLSLTALQYISIIHSGISPCLRISTSPFTVNTGSSSVYV